MEFTANQVWGLAIKADILNNGYCKEAKYSILPDNIDDVINYASKKKKEANKILVKQWLHNNVHPTEDEIVAGQECRAHFKSYIFKMITGELSSFQQTVVKVIEKDVFTKNDMMEIAVVSCLPNQVRRDRQDDVVKTAMYSSVQLTGKQKDTVVGTITVLKSVRSDFVNRYKIHAQLENSVVDFWCLKSLQGTHQIKGKIKEQRSNNTTALNYVKIVS